MGLLDWYANFDFSSTQVRWSDRPFAQRPPLGAARGYPPPPLVIEGIGEGARNIGAKAFAVAYRAGTVELELVPQGTLIERIRCGGAGIGGSEPSVPSASGASVSPLSTGVCAARSPLGAVSTYSSRGRVGSAETRSATVLFDGLATRSVKLPLVPKPAVAAQCAYTSTSLVSSPVTRSTPWPTVAL